MKRAAPVLLAILLGAAVTALAMGVFLKLANDDRARLAADINRARDAAAQALADKEQIAAEASEKVEAANREVERAEWILKRLEQEQKLLADAKPLSKPSTRELRGWTAVTSLPLGINFLIPPTMTVLQNNDTAIRVARKDHETDGDWISIRRPPPEANEPPRNDSGLIPEGMPAEYGRPYLVDDHLITRWDSGSGDDQLMHLDVEHAASSTHRMIIRPDPSFGADGLERLLATMEFAD